MAACRRQRVSPRCDQFPPDPVAGPDTGTWELDVRGGEGGRQDPWECAEAGEPPQNLKPRIQWKGGGLISWRVGTGEHASLSVFDLHICSGVDGWTEGWTDVGRMGRW